MSYRRDVFEKGFSKVKKELYKETNNYHIDTYTGKPLKPGEPWDFEHIISAKEFSSLPYVKQLDFESQSRILNHRKNIGFTMRNINKSKGKHPLIKWLETESNGRKISNAEYYNIDIKKAKKLRKKVLEFLTSEIKKAA
jgi:hypothetical protein